MEDLGQALNVNPDLLFLGGGNPARVPKMERVVAEHLTRLVKQPDYLHKLVGVYQSPQGSEVLIDSLVSYFNAELGWPLRACNIAIASGSQSAFFILMNMLAGPSAVKGRAASHICFPLMPDYLGYADQGIDAGCFRGWRPDIALIGEHRFKYHIAFDRLNVDEHTAAFCLSRPANPSGNIISDSELSQLSALAAKHSIPLVLDLAYGQPFPGVEYEAAKLLWDENAIFVLSLSKLGLPGTRTGIVLANEDVIRHFVRINTVLCLANGSLGPGLLHSMLKSGELPRLSEQILVPFYRAKRDTMLACIAREFAGINYRVHLPEGAFFVWLWLPDLPISSADFYHLMKRRGVLIMAGEPFFFALDESWEHSRQCIRLTYCQDDKVISEAITLLARELRCLV